MRRMLAVLVQAFGLTMVPLSLAKSAEPGSDSLQAILIGTGSPIYNPLRSGPAVLIRSGDTCPSSEHLAQLAA